MEHKISALAAHVLSQGLDASSSGNAANILDSRE